MKVYLIRHTSVDVPSGTCYGQTDVPLKDTFREEAAVCKSRIEGIRFDRVYTSPLSRCTRLAAFCGYADAERDDRLKEINCGKWEMRRYDDISDPRLREWYDDYLHVPATGGESFMDLLKRVSSFLEELKGQAYENVLIFAHGGVLISAQVYAGTIKPEQGFEAISPYGGVVVIDL